MYIYVKTDFQALQGFQVTSLDDPWLMAMNGLGKHGWLCRKSACCLPAIGTSSSCTCCSTRIRRKDRAMKPKATPLPWGKLITICTVLFVNQFGINMLFPFLPFMVHDFFPDLSRTEIGQKAGYLGCAYFVGNFIGSLFWGWLSDVVGRRPVMLTGMCAIIFSEVFFAFSQNFAWAVAARFLWGALNGNIGIAKTYISEVCDDSNQAKGFTIVGTTGGVGRLSGSVVGGFLSQPASKYTALQLPIFCDYPYSFPVLVGAGMSFVSLVAAWLFLDETLHKKIKKPPQDEPSDQSDDISTPSQSTDDSGIDLSASDPLMTPVREDSDTEMVNLSPIDSIQSDMDDAPILMADSDVDTDNDFDAISSDTELMIRERGRSGNRRQCPRKLCFNPLYPCIKFKERIVGCVATPVAIIAYFWNAEKRGSWSPRKALNKKTISRKAMSVLLGLKRTAVLMLDRRVFLGTFLYALYAFIGIMSVELLPLLLVTAHQYGGYNMDDSEIGVVLMVSSLVQLIFQLLMFPRISKGIGYRHTFRLGLIIFGLACFLLPFSNQITGPIPSAPLPNITTFDNETSGSGMYSYDDIGYCNYTLDSNATATSVNDNSVARVPIPVWIVLIIISAMLSISRIMSITATMVLINNASLPATRGTVNGIGQSLAAIGRSIGPVVGAPVFAWSEGLGLGWPLNFHFVFDLMMLSSVAIVLISFLLPKSIEQKRDMLESTGNSTDTKT